jgi:hypothetical protein
MQIGPIPLFFDTWTFRLPKIDSAEKIKNQREIQNIRWKIKFPAENPNFQPERKGFRRKFKNSAGKSKHLLEKISSSGKSKSSSGKIKNQREI